MACMNDPMALLKQFIQDNLSSANPTTTQMSGRIFTSPTERDFITPSILIGPCPEGPSTWLGATMMWYKQPVPVTAYDAYDLNPLNTSTTPRDAKIRTWNLIDSVRTLIANSKNLSADGKIAVVYNYGTPRKVNLTRWRPPVLAVVSTVMFEWVDDLSNSGVIP